MTAYVSVSNIECMKLVMKLNGAYELNWTWLPYWVVADQEFRDAAGVIMHATAESNPDDDETFEKLNEAITQALVNRYPESGIADLIAWMAAAPSKVVEGIRE